MLRVAIDGPGGTGKSTIAKAVAEELSLEYIDTGAMYRAVALKCIRNGVALDDEAAVTEMLESTDIDFLSSKVTLDGEDVSGLIRTNEVSMAASKVSKFGPVREKVDAVTRKLASTKNVIMDGRDIGSFVITDAEVKIFMTADPAVRAKRRYEQLLEAGKEADYDTIFKEIEERDYQDTHRDLHPLKQAEDAIYLDTSDMSIEENIRAVLEIIAKSVEGEA